MQVVATAVGFDGLCQRQPKEVFEMPEGSTATWFKPHEATKTLSEETPKVKGPKGKGDQSPKTLSEAAAAANTSGTPADLA